MLKKPTYPNIGPTSPICHIALLDRAQELGWGSLTFFLLNERPERGWDMAESSTWMRPSKKSGNDTVGRGVSAIGTRGHGVNRPDPAVSFVIEPSPHAASRKLGRKRLVDLRDAARRWPKGKAPTIHVGEGAARLLCFLTDELG